MTQSGEFDTYSSSGSREMYLEVVAARVVSTPEKRRRRDAFIVCALVDLLLLQRNSKRRLARAGTGAGTTRRAEEGKVLNVVDLGSKSRVSCYSHDA